MLDIDADGVAQITDQLDGDTIYEAIHVISHGTEDGLSLGNTDLNNDNVGQYQNEFTSWANSLTDGADLLLYGCDLASTDEGLTLLATLATFTTADVAASDDVTGHRSLGGDWILEFSTGDIEAGLPFSDQLQEDWVYTLDVPTDILITNTSLGGLSINDDGGNDAYLHADDGGVLFDGQTSLTFEVQFSTDQANSNAPLISYTDSDGNVEFEIQITASGNLAIEINGESVVASGTDYGLLQDGEQHSLAFTWDNSSGDYQVFVNGALNDSGAALAISHELSAGGTLLFGQAQTFSEGGFNTSEVFSGTLYNARLFSDLRTASEISSNYESEVDFDEPEILAQWNFDDLSKNGIITESVSGNNLTVKHTSESGFSASTSLVTLVVDENTSDGTIVGLVTGIDADRENRITELLGADSDLAYSAETGKFYEFWGNSGDFDVATSGAIAERLNGIGGELATIYSANEQEVVRDTFIAGRGDERLAWLGGSDATVEGEWRWQSAGVDTDQFWQGDQDGSNVDGRYEAFQTNEPSNGFTNADQDYLAIQGLGWQDWANDEVRNAMLQWDADSVLDETDELSYSIESQTVAGAFVIDDDSGEISVADSSLLNLVSDGMHTLSINITDEDLNSFSKAVAVEYTGEPAEPNEAPTNEGDLPAAITVEEDVPSDVDLSLIELSDVDADDANGDELTVTLTTSTGGQLSGVAETGMGITLGGTATALTVTGTQTDLNSYFGTASNIQYVHSTADLNGDGADTIQVSVNDNGNTGLGGGEDVNLGTVDVNITAINDTPKVTGAGSPYEAVEQEPPIDIHGTGLSVSDVDADDGTLLIAVLVVGEGSILVDAGNSGVTRFASAINLDTATLRGTETQLNNLLEGSGTGTITYVADSDAPSATTTLTLTVNDRGNTGNDPGLTGGDESEQDSVSQTINITAVNDSPEILGQELITNGNFDNRRSRRLDDRQKGVTSVAESLNFGSGNTTRTA